MPLSRFHPLIAEWFQAKIGQPTDVQVQAWPAIQSGGDVLIAAPTGSGKTFAAFLSCIDHHYERKQQICADLDGQGLRQYRVSVAAQCIRLSSSV